MEGVINAQSRSERIRIMNRFKGHRPAKSCLTCEYTEEMDLTENYYSHVVLTCHHPETEGLIVHDYGYCKDNNGGIHPACPLRNNYSKPLCYDATEIKSVYAHIHDDKDVAFNYAVCPYCESINKLPNSKIGYRYCGSCGKIFNVK